MDNHSELVKIIYDIAKHASTVSIATAVVAVALFRDETPYGALLLLAFSIVLSILSMLLAAAVLGTVVARGRSLEVAVVCQMGCLTGAWVLWVLAIFWVAMVMMG